MSDDERFIWIVRWGDFQHYEPRRDRGPAWIKQHTAQLADARYLRLTDRQRSLLHDLRMMFATMRGRLPDDRGMIARQRNAQTRDADIVALANAGLIALCSRATLDRNLEEVYASRARARAREKELLRSSSKSALESRSNERGSSAQTKPISDAGVCPECHVGGGLHSVECPTLVLSENHQ